MATEAEIQQQIDTDIVPNGQNEITADVLRPVLAKLLGFTADQVGNLEELETTAQDNTVEAINEVRQIALNPPEFAAAPVKIINADSDFELKNLYNKGVYEVADNSGNAVNITIPVDNNTIITDPKIGDFYDIFQTSLVSPLFVWDPDIFTILREPGELMELNGIGSGIRLIKLGLNKWRFYRLKSKQEGLSKLNTDESLVFNQQTGRLEGNVGNVTQRFNYAQGNQQVFTLIDTPTNIVYIAVNGTILADEFTQWSIDVENRRVTILDTLSAGDIININYHFYIS